MGGVAILHQAQLIPTKIDLLRAWVPRQPWLGDADASSLEPVGAYRFDDPAGAVGVETHLVRTADGQILHVPLTYRDAPAADAEESLIATMQHSALGERWVYDGCGDAVWLQTMVTAIMTGGTQAELEVLTDAGPQRREPTARVTGSGSSGAAVPPVHAPISCTAEGTTTVVRSSDVLVTLFRVIDPHPAGPEHQGAGTLVGTWAGQATPAVLAVARIS